MYIAFTLRMTYTVPSNYIYMHSYVPDELYYLLIIAIATKVFIGKLPATKGLWVIIG